MIEKNTSAFYLLEMLWVFFLFHNELYESQQARDLPKAVTLQNICPLEYP